MYARKIWLITGISSGLGKALANTVIKSGDFVIGTFRNISQVTLFNEKYRNKALAVLLDVTDRSAVKNLFEIIQQKFGRLDVLVNNAGNGFAGAIEEASDKEIREIIEVNFFAALHITQMALPFFRKQKNGFIVQISSQAGIKATPGFGIYNASKFALEGFSEALAAEIAPFGIKLTIVEPGPFRTNFAGTSFKEAKNRIADYESTAGIFRDRMKQVDGKQEGDPVKAAHAILGIIRNTGNPPLRLPLGKSAVISLTAKLESVTKDLNNFKSIAENSVYS